MPNIVKIFLDEMKGRNISFVDEYIPYYIASVGCHIFNMANRIKNMYVQAGTTPNMRLHILMVAFPGFGKTFFQKQLLDNPKYSLVKGSQVQCKFEGDMTSAAFVGQILPNKDGGEPYINKGICENRSDHIIGIDEFSAMTGSFKQQYNAGFDTNLLKALDTGDVELARGAGERAYHTDLTLWAGVQPARYDLSSGFSRRFLYLTIYPTMKDLETLDDAREKMKGIRIPSGHMNAIRQALDVKVGEIYHSVKGIYFSDRFRKEMRAMKMLHYEKDLLERLAIGYSIMKQETINGQIMVDMTDDVKDLIVREDRMRREAQMTSPSRIINKFISTEKSVDYGYTKYTLVKMGMIEADVEQGVNSLVARGIVKKEGKDLVILKPYH